MDDRNHTQKSPDAGMADRSEDDSRRDERDTDVTFTTTGDGTGWDSGRTSSVTGGSRLENDLREADAESPGVPGPKPYRGGSPDDDDRGA
jgi:hypothetical protein